MSANVPTHPGFEGMERLRDSLQLLRSLSGSDGIHASLSATANYRAIFARDAVMAGITGLLMGDAIVCAGLARTLEKLRDLQGSAGQVASNFEVRPGAPPHVSFGTIAPRLDGATWYLVGVALAVREGLVERDAFARSVADAVACLDAIEYNGRHLLYVPTGGNWADEYIFEGYILYDQVLRAWALRLLAPLFGVEAWSEKSARIAETISERYFSPYRARPEHPIAAYTPVRRFEMFDLAACALLAVSGIAPDRATQALDWIDANFLSSGHLVPAFSPVIEEGDPDWGPLRRYHLHAFRNAPHEYHNGGIWPIWLGWLALAFDACGRGDPLARLRALTARHLDALPAFAFEEYFHGRTGAPLGTPRMAYTATGMAFLALAGTERARALFRTP